MKEKDISKNCRDYTYRLESMYSSYATKNCEAKRRLGLYQPDLRTEFSRDSDRILHSYAYARYIDKTQAFYLVNNDHITHRSLHVQIVSRIARTIGRALHLNEDLTEAISLGHDIGHPPYGHAGEKCLSEFCQKHSAGPFLHNIQSIRFLDSIEKNDLTMQVLDGIMCHNGEKNDLCLKPERCTGWNEFDEKFNNLQNNCHDIAPMTAEGCVVRFADTIAYIGRDIQDALEVGLINGEDKIPDEAAEILGHTNREVINHLIIDLIKNSSTKNECVISYSEDVFSALSSLKEFNYKNIYENKKLTRQKEKIKNMYSVLFENYLDDLADNNKKSAIYKDFLNTSIIKDTHEYQLNTAPSGIVRDYIAGMTDNYFEKRFCDLVMPKKTEGKFP